MIDLIPGSLKDRLFDALVEFVATQAERAGGTALGHRLRALLASDGTLRSATAGALRRTVTRFERAYADVELVARPGGWGEAKRAATAGFGKLKRRCRCSGVSTCA